MSIQRSKSPSLSGVAGGFAPLDGGLLIPSQYITPPVGASYKRTSGDYTTGSTTMTAVDNTNMNLTITTLARRVQIGVVATVFHSSTSSISLDIELDGSLLGAPTSGGQGGLVQQRQPTALREENLSFTYLTDVLTAASHTFKLMWCTPATTATLKGATGSSAYSLFWVMETWLTA